MASPSIIFSVDVGGTGVKGACIDPSGNFISDKIRIDTPRIHSPKKLVKTIASLTKDMPAFEAISVGFPGLIQKGIVRSCPTLRTDCLLGVNLEKIMQAHFHLPVRVANDAEVQALPVIKGKDVEVVLTLGTGFGFALFQDGWASHLELSTHPLSHGETYNERLGDAALRRKGKKAWLKRVFQALETIRLLTHYNRLTIGGGNACHLQGRVDKKVRLISNDYGIVGGAWLWREKN